MSWYNAVLEYDPYEMTDSSSWNSVFTALCEKDKYIANIPQIEGDSKRMSFKTKDLKKKIAPERRTDGFVTAVTEQQAKQVSYDRIEYRTPIYS